MDNSHERLLATLALLEKSRTALRQRGRSDTAQLLSVAILDLRMKLNRIGDGELTALCEQVMLPEATDDSSHDDGPTPRQRPLLRLVK